MGSLFSKPKAPKPPDPGQLATAQGAANKETAIAQALLNMVNQQTPFGTLEFEQRGEVDGVPQFSASTELAPWQAAINRRGEMMGLDLLRRTHHQLENNVRPVIREGFDISGAPGVRRAELPEGELPDMPDTMNVPRLSGLPGGGEVPGFSLAGLPERPTADDAVRQRTEDAMFQRAKSQLDPIFEDRQRRLETQLVNQGFARGSEAYNRALERFRQSENDAYQSALQDAIMFGGQEQSRLFDLGSQARQQALQEAMTEFGAGSQQFGMSQAARQQALNEIMSRFNMGQSAFDQAMRRRQQGLSEQGQRFGQEAQLFGLDQQARQQAIQELALQRNQPINELMAMLGQAPQVGLPGFAPVPQTGVAGTDVIGATALNQQAQQNAFNAQQAQQQGLLGALGNLGGAALGGWASAGFPALAWASDPKLKEAREPVETERVLEGMRDIPVEEWQYKGDPQRNIGPMADDWAERFGGDGHTINPVSAFGMSMAAIQALADKVDRLEHQRA